MKKTIRDFDLDGKRVIIRLDLNVPMQDGKITDDSRIKKALPTIEYAIKNNAKVILMSHLGRIKKEEDKDMYSLENVAFRLSELLDKEIIFVTETRGNLLEDEIYNLENGQILLMENTRFEDFPDKKESSNDEELGKYWASLGDIFINDAFGTCHRSHCSNVGIASYLPSGIGFLIEKELSSFSKVIENPIRPYSVILGGSKVSDKISIIENIIPKVDYLLIGGVMAYTFLRAKDKPIGNSLLEESQISFASKILNQYEDKIILPIDHIVKSEDGAIREILIENTQKGDIGFDIGTKTLEKYNSILEKSKTILWNGPVGKFEEKEFSNGTFTLLKMLSEKNAVTILGGGDTSAAAHQLLMEDEFTHISTGGGASLELLEGKCLPGIECIDEKEI